MAETLPLVEAPRATRPATDRYKWIALSNTTLAVLLATLDASITIIAMPDIFRGISLDPLVPSNSFYLLWMILGYLLVMSVLVVPLGRLGDMYGRVRIYNLGFVIYTVASLILAIDWMTGREGATFLIVFRLVQGVGGACLLANSGAILTDAFPVGQRGMALGINNIVGVSGMFVGLVVGGILAPIDWRLVFLISVPIGLFGTVWGYLKLEERSKPRPSPIDWWGNLTFAAGLVMIMVSVTFGIRPYGGNATGWTSPRVLFLLGGGLLFLVAFVVVESRVENPMFRLSLFRIRAFTFGTLSTFLAAIARGGLMFMLIIWLQGIWLPQHGYSFTQTPLWAGIYMLPLTVGMLIAGPDGRRARRSLRLAAVRDGGHAPDGAQLRAAPAAADELLLPLVLGDPVHERPLDRAVRRPEPRRRDEQPAAWRPRQRRRHEPDLPELGPGAVDRDLLHADDPRPLDEPAAHAQLGPRGARRRRGDRPSTSATCRPCRSCSPRSSATTRSSTCSAPTRSRDCRRTIGWR